MLSRLGSSTLVLLVLATTLGCASADGAGEATGDTVSEALGTQLWTKVVTRTTGIVYPTGQANWVTTMPTGESLMGGWLQGNSPGGGMHLMFASPSIWVGVAPIQDRQWVAKYDAAGTVLWAKAIVTNSFEWIYRGAVNSAGEFYTVGSKTLTTSSTATLNDVGMLRKFDALGNPIWTKQLGVTGDHGLSGIALDSAGNVVVSGGGNGSVDFGAGVVTVSDAFYAIKYDPTGALLWGNAYSGLTSGVDSIDNVSVATVGNRSYFIGNVHGSYTIGAPVAGNGHLWVGAFSATGVPAFTRIFGNLAFTTGPSAVGIDSLGKDVAIGCNFSGNAKFDSTILLSAGSGDVCAARLNGTTGMTVWAKRFGNASADGLGAFATGVLPTGGSLPPAVGLVINNSGHVEFRKLDQNGLTAWARTVAPSVTTGSPYVSGVGIDFDRLGNGFIAGGFAGPTNFGGGPVTTPLVSGSYEQEDFLTKVDP